MMNLFYFLLQWLRIRAAISQTTEEERICLSKYATGKKNLVEVGVFQGVTTRVLRKAMANEGLLWCIDPFFKNRLGICFYGMIAKREVGEITNGRIIWLEMTSAQALDGEKFGADCRLDFVFIDGDHSWEGIEGDWNGFSPMVRPGGIIALHDSRNRGGCGSERFTNEVILKDGRFRVIATEDSLTILERL
jgi:predicted O-methyltransferase YrrM